MGDSRVSLGGLMNQIHKIYSILNHTTANFRSQKHNGTPAGSRTQIFGSGDQCSSIELQEHKSL